MMAQRLRCLLLTTNLWLAGCGGPLPTTEGWVQPKLRELVAEFFATAERLGIVALGRVGHVGTAALDSDLNGLCWSPTGVVLVADDLAGDVLKATVYHELAHCALLVLRHDPDPDGWMAAVEPDLVRDEDEFTAFWPYVLRSNPWTMLFQSKRN
jgi:hypothetical protein